MSEPRETGNGRILCVTVALVGLALPARLPAANPETIAVQVTFVAPIAISEANALQFGSLDQNLADLESVTVAPDVSGAGYALTDFRCNYAAGTDAVCEGAGYLGTSVASGSLLVGATLTGDGTAVAGAADGSFDITVTYQ